jgi:hypothetical protein
LERGEHNHLRKWFWVKQTVYNSGAGSSVIPSRFVFIENIVDDLATN